MLDLAYMLCGVPRTTRVAVGPVDQFILNPVSDLPRTRTSFLGNYSNTNTPWLAGKLLDVQCHMPVSGSITSSWFCLNFGQCALAYAYLQTVARMQQICRIFDDQVLGAPRSTRVCGKFLRTHIAPQNSTKHDTCL